MAVATLWSQDSKIGCIWEYRICCISRLNSEETKFETGTTNIISEM